MEVVVEGGGGETNEDKKRVESFFSRRKLFGLSLAVATGQHEAPIEPE